MKLKQGYNCVGHVWVGDARVTAVFDTGACRNSIDGKLLDTMLKNERTSPAVSARVDIEPQICQGFR